MLESVILEGFNFQNTLNTFKQSTGIVSDSIDQNAVTKVITFLENNPGLRNAGATIISEAVKDKTGIDVFALYSTISSLSDFSGSIAGTPGSGGGVGGGIGLTDSPNNNGNDLGIFRTSLLTDPVEVKIVSKLGANWYGSFYPKSIPSDYSTLHLNTMKFRIDAYPFDVLHAPDVFLTSVIAPQFLYAMQRKLKYNLPTTVTVSRIRLYLNELIIALNYFYFFGSIIGWNNNALNRHDSMTYLASKLTATDRQNYLNLKWKLSGEAIPPNLKMLSAWLYQTYSSSSVPGSSLIKFCPVDLKSDNAPFGYYPDTTDLGMVLSRLNSFTDISNHFCTAFGEWINPELKDSCPSILHDDTFTTVFMNSPCLVQTSAGAQSHFRTSGPNEPYSMASTNVDPIAYCLATVAGTDNKNYSGVLAPFASLSTFANLKHNQWSFANDGTNFGLVPTFSSTGINYSAPRTFSEVSGPASVSNVVPMCEPYFGLTVAGVTESCYALMELLFSFEDMKSPMGMNQDFSGPRTNKGSNNSNRNRKGK